MADSSIIKLLGKAVVQVYIDRISGAAIQSRPDLAYVFDDMNQRHGQFQFWKEDTVISIDSIDEQFQGRAWTLAGTGFLAKKLSHLGSVGKAYGVLALWPVAIESAERFALLVERNALTSVEEEPGCYAFGTFRSVKDPSVFCLVEIFGRESDFQEHSKSKHFHEFIEFARPRYLGDRSQTIKGVVKFL